MCAKDESHCIKTFCCIKTSHCIRWAVNWIDNHRILCVKKQQKDFAADVTVLNYFVVHKHRIVYVEQQSDLKIITFLCSKAAKWPCCCFYCIILFDCTQASYCVCWAAKWLENHENFVCQKAQQSDFAAEFPVSKTIFWEISTGAKFTHYFFRIFPWFPTTFPEFSTNYWKNSNLGEISTGTNFQIGTLLTPFWGKKIPQICGKCVILETNPTRATYRVPKTHRIPYLYRSFSAKVTYI